MFLGLCETDCQLEVNSLFQAHLAKLFIPAIDAGFLTPVYGEWNMHMPFLVSG